MQALTAARQALQEQNAPAAYQQLKQLLGTDPDPLTKNVHFLEAIALFQRS